MIRKVNEIHNVRYGIRTPEGEVILFEPSHEEVDRAIAEGQLEHRGFQDDLEVLRSEWQNASDSDPAEFYRLQRAYHAQRIAYFVVNGWEDKIRIKEDGTMIDGLHRLKAAIHRGLQEVEVSVEQ